MKSQFDAMKVKIYYYDEKGVPMYYMSKSKTGTMHVTASFKYGKRMAWSTGVKIQQWIEKQYEVTAYKSYI